MAEVVNSRKRRETKTSQLSRISPVMLILATIIFIAVVPFARYWYEFAGLIALIVLLSVLAGTGWGFWGKYLKISTPLVILSTFFNWIIGMPDGFKALAKPGILLSQSQNLEALTGAITIGGRFAIAIYFSLLLVYACSREELVWGLARLSEKLFRSPVTGEILGLAVLSVPFYTDSLAKVRRIREIPKAVASVFNTSRHIVSTPIIITGKKSGWLLFSLASAVLAVGIIL